MVVTLLESGRRRALDAFVRGMMSLERADRGAFTAAEEAIRHLHVCLEWVTPQTWPCLWVEAQIAKADAYILRGCGDPLENAQAAIACYRAALCASLDDVWQWDGELASPGDGSTCGDAGEP